MQREQAMHTSSIVRLQPIINIFSIRFPFSVYFLTHSLL